MAFSTWEDIEESKPAFTLTNLCEKESPLTECVQTTLVLSWSYTEPARTNNQTAAEGGKIQFPEGPFRGKGVVLVPSAKTRLWWSCSLSTSG